MEIKGKYNYELIEDYLSGLLDKETSARIEELLKTDETARSIAKGILTLKQHFSEKEIEAYMDGVYNAHLETIVQNIKPKKGLILWKIAASILLLGISSLFVFKNTSLSINEIIEDEIATTYPISQHLRGSGDATLRNALIAYNNGEYKKSIRLLAKDESAQGTFTRGLSLFYLKNYGQAAEDFSKSLMLNSRYEEQSRWFLAMSYIKSGEETKAIEILNKILNIKNHYKAKESKKLLRLLTGQNPSAQEK